MGKHLLVEIKVKRVPLTQGGQGALRRLATYDMLVFSSKHAQTFFVRLVRERGMKVPRRARVLRVGPRLDLLRYSVAGKRILYPRSALAPFDIIRSLRKRGACVLPLVLYTATPVLLTRPERRALVSGRIHSLAFKSPSGVHGLLSQLTPRERRIARGLPAFCIGATTRAAAREAGFSKATIKRL